LALAACQGQNQASPTLTTPTVVIQPAATLTEDTPAVTDTVQQAVAGAPPGCTVISPQKTPGPTEQSVFPPVTDKDWSTGPKGAAITLIEYSDFQ
jgi:hypothetical protein